MQWKAVIQERRERWYRFLHTSEIPFLFIVRPPATVFPPRPYSIFHPGNEKEFIDYSWSFFKKQCELISIIDDDFVPYLSCVTGTEIFAEAFGCKVERPETNMPFALPKVFTSREAESLSTPVLTSSSLVRFFDIADELYRRSEGIVPLKIVDIQSPMDITALIWEKSALMMAMLDAPDTVKHLSFQVRQLLTDFLDEWFHRYGNSFMAHYPDYLMDRGITLSEDECGSVNSSMFEEFFLDHLNFLSERYGGIGIHCCANSRHQWPNFKKIKGLKVLNFVCPPTCKGEEFVGDALKFFAGHCIQYHYGWLPHGPYDSWLSQYPPDAKVIIDITAKSVDEARDICSVLRKCQECCVNLQI